MAIYTRPWWFRWTIGFIFSMTIGNLFYTARITNFLNHFSFLVKILNFFGQDFRPSHQIWEKDITTEEISGINYFYEQRGEPQLATYIFEKDGIAEKDRHYRIHCPGNSGQCARHFKELREVTTLTDISTITFSHPGIGESKGFVLDQDDLINAVFQQAKYLIKEKKVPPHRITVSGMSMGAAAAVCAVRKINEYYQGNYPLIDSQEEKSDAENPKRTVNYFGDRTFSDSTKEVVDQVLVTVLHPPIPIIKQLLKCLFELPGFNLIKKILITVFSYILLVSFKILLGLMNWDMQPQKHYDELDCAEKAIVYVKPRTLGEGTGISKVNAKFFDRYRTHGDTVIRTHVSLKTSPEQKAVFKKELLELQEELSSGEYKKAESRVELLVGSKLTINAIVHANLMRLQGELKSTPTKKVMKKRFIKIVSAFKGERLEGIPKTRCCGSTNAHDARYQSMQPRQAENKKWFFTDNRDVTTKTPYLVDYYFRFDRAVKKKIKATV